MRVDGWLACISTWKQRIRCASCCCLACGLESPWVWEVCFGGAMWAPEALVMTPVTTLVPLLFVVASSSVTGVAVVVVLCRDRLSFCAPGRLDGLGELSSLSSSDSSSLLVSESTSSGACAVRAGGVFLVTMAGAGAE